MKEMGAMNPGECVLIIGTTSNPQVCMLPNIGLNFIPLLVWYIYIGKCMVTLINIDDGIKGSIYGYQICNTSHILISVGTSRRESLYMLDLLYGLIPF